MFELSKTANERKSTLDVEHLSEITKNGLLIHYKVTGTMSKVMNYAKKRVSKRCNLKLLEQTLKNQKEKTLKPFETAHGIQLTLSIK